MILLNIYPRKLNKWKRYKNDYTDEFPEWLDKYIEKSSDGSEF